MRTPSAMVTRSSRTTRDRAVRRLGILTMVAMATAAVIPVVALSSQAGAGTLLPGILSPATKNSPAIPSLSQDLAAAQTDLNAALGAQGTVSSGVSSVLNQAVSQAATSLPGVPAQIGSALSALSALKSSPTGASTPGKIGPVLLDAPAAEAPATPTNVQASQAGAPPDITVSWSNGSGGAAVQSDLVQLGTVVAGVWTYVTQVRCGACTSTTLRELNFGSSYQAKVYAVSTSGVGQEAISPVVTLHTSCTAGACVNLNATSSLGEATHAAAGLLNSVYPEGNDGVDLKALGTSMYRSGVIPTGSTFNFSSFNVATNAGSQTIIQLEAIEQAQYGDNPPTPWSNWSNYSSWVTTTVRDLLASGKPIDYFEIYNEPGGNDGYYSPAGYASETPALLLKQFLVAYDAIKAVDPFAQVIGPELEHWSDYPGQYGTSDHAFDMVTFLNYAVANHIQLAALSWHEIDDSLGPNPEENTLDPAMIESHVAEARALLAARPSLGDPKIFIDEYGMPEVQKIPGWDVNYLAALTDAKVNSATRACWDGDCNLPDLDGLLYSNGTSPLADFYVRTIYASMSGDMITTTSSSDTVAALGSYNALTGTLTGLVGRGVGCSQNLIACEPSFVDAGQATGTSVDITLTVPWSSGSTTLKLTHISGASPIFPSAGPSVSKQTVKVTSDGLDKGTISFSIPDFLDGDAYGISLTH